MVNFGLFVFRMLNGFLKMDMKLQNNKKKRAPGAGRKRPASLPPGVPLVQMPPVKMTAKMLDFLKAHPGGLSEAVREMINDKMNAQ